MANYLITHYKGIYRLKVPYDKKTNQFARNLNGTFEDIDCYIDCLNRVQVSYYGKSILEAYVPSLGRGRNIVKAIKEEFGEDLITYYKETATEVIFRFNAKYMGNIAKYLKPRTSGANISPFSSKNLPRNKAYKIPDEQVKGYKDIVAQIPTERILTLTHSTNNYIKSLITKRNTWDDMKSDMAMKGLKGKEYIHSIGKWDEYLEYLRSNVL